MKVLLKYKQRIVKTFELKGPCGNQRWVRPNRIVDYDQEEKLEIKLVNKRIKELRSFSNRNYHTFRIYEPGKNKINPDYKTATHLRNSEKDFNVACYNGSAHIKSSFDILDVTCEKCLKSYLIKNSITINHEKSID